jgi:hypothetical protein
MTDITSPCAVIEGESSTVTFGEYWHIAPDDRAFAGPFTSKEAAIADATKYMQDDGGRYNVDDVTIVKTVARGHNTITVETNFHDV